MREFAHGRAFHILENIHMASRSHLETTLIYRILAAPTRVRVLQAINGQKTVVEVATETKLPYTFVSRILSDLTSKGMLKVNTQGAQKRYYISNFKLRDALETMFAQDDGEFPDITNREEGVIADVTNREDSTSGV